MTKGRYWDTITDLRGNVLHESGWHDNAIVERCDLLLSAPLRGEAGFGGIGYWAVGGGLDSWDGAGLRPEIHTTALTDEIARLAPVRIDYLAEDPEQGGEYILSETPTNILEIEAIFDGSALVTESGALPLREFGLFGGDATAAANSGYLIDYVIHPRIDLSADNILTRRLRITFNGSATTAPVVTSVVEPTPLGAALSVRSIDGIDSQYMSALDARGVRSVNDLAVLDAGATHPDIPDAKLKTFRSKARLLLRRQAAIDPNSLLPFAGNSLASFLEQNPSILATEAGTTLEVMEQLQESLGDLEVALDTALLDTIRVGDLFG